MYATPHSGQPNPALAILFPFLHPSTVFILIKAAQLKFLIIIIIFVSVRFWVILENCVPGLSLSLSLCVWRCVSLSVAAVGRGP